MIKFEHVSKHYTERGDALRQISFTIETGEMVFLTGHSGAGKSTLLRLIGLLERPNTGRIHVDHVNLDEIRRREIPLHRRKVGMIFQDHRLLPDRTIYDNVALPLIVAGNNTESNIAKRVGAALEAVNLRGKERRLPVELSGGEQQRVGIARAIVASPSVLLADEPTGNLDPDLSMEIFHLFERFRGGGKTILVATHDIHLIKSMGLRTLTLNKGRLESDKPASKY